MSRTFLALVALPILIVGCGGSKEAPMARNPAGSSVPPTRAQVSFNLNTGRSSGRVSLQLHFQDRTTTMYVGTWKGIKARFTEVSTHGTLTLWNSENCLTTYQFANYKADKFSSTTVQSNVSTCALYSPTDEYAIYPLFAATASP